MVSMYTRGAEECTGEVGRARHTRVQSPHTFGHGAARGAAAQGQAAKERHMVARPDIGAGVVRTGGQGCHSRSKRSVRNALRGKQANVRAQGLARGRRASTRRSRLPHVGRGRGGRQHAPGGAAITQHHRCTETGDAHAQMANAQPAQSDVWGAWQCVRTGGRGCQILEARGARRECPARQADARAKG